MFDAVASNGHSEIVRFLSENRKDAERLRMEQLSAANGHFEIVRHLHEKRRDDLKRLHTDDV
jgi:hypothetical protein